MDECKQFRTLKERGEYVELRFMVQAMLHGFQVSRPWGTGHTTETGKGGRQVAGTIRAGEMGN